MSTDETVTFLEIDQPLCSLTYGVAPCTAVLGTTGAAKCYNTRATCQSAANYAPGSLTLRFAEAQEGLQQYGNFIPTLISVSTSPGIVNLGGMDPSTSALGIRESVTVKLADHQHSDLLVDKYRLERFTGAASSPSVPFNPEAAGTFWGKWRARNPYYSSYPSYRARVRRGYIGQALADMAVRSYVIDSIGVNEDGSVTLVLKDLFGKLEDKKAVAPRASLGELAGDISNVAGSATLAPAGIGNSNYPSAGWVRIGDECIAFTRVNDTLTLTRAALNTVAADHATQDAVQIILAYQAQRAHSIAYDLFISYTPFQPSDINKVDWDAAADAVSMANLYTAYITQPTAVSKLVGELSIQAGFTLFPDPETGLIIFVPLVATAAPTTVDDNGWIVKGSLSIKRQESKRLSEVWVYYGQRDPTRALTEAKNYRSRYVSVDLVSEGPNLYGTPMVDEVFSRWIPQFGRASATETGDRRLTMFKDPPIEAGFAVHKDRAASLPVTGLFTLNTDLVQDALGVNLPTTHSVISRESKDIGGTTVAVKSQQTFFSSASGIRTLYIDNDAFVPLNMRTEHDKLYAPPSGTETVRVIIGTNVRIGSNSIAAYSLRTGLWPVGTVLQLIVNVGGEIWGMGGRGGKGGNTRQAGSSTDYVADAGANGENGGPSFLAERAISITNNGTINGGAPGGGGGGGSCSGSAGLEAGGSGGGGGRSLVAAAGGPAGVFEVPGFPPGQANGYTGNTGTWPAPGARAPNATPGGICYGGYGGAGAQPGGSAEAGQTGYVDTPFYDDGIHGAGGSPGTAGHAVDGNSFITWVASGTINGVIA